MPDLGDPATATLLVDPYDGTTDADLELFAPDGTPATPAASTVDDGHTWTAPIVYSAVGWWLLSWTVTGTGAGVQHQRVYVPPAPMPGGPPIYLPLEELKEARRIAPDDTRDDAALTRVLRRASRAIDDRTDRHFWLDDTATARTFIPRGRVRRYASYGCWGELLLLDDIGSAAGLTVEIGSDAAGWTIVTGYDLQPDNALARFKPVDSLLRLQLPWALHPLSRVRVTARWGWPQIPESIAEATLLLANRLYLRKDSPEGLAASGEWGAVRMSRLDHDVEALVQKYVRPGIGG